MVTCLISRDNDSKSKSEQKSLVSHLSESE